MRAKPFDPTLYIRSQDCIAQNALTNSKRAECFVKGVYQTHATHGQGPFLFDSNGRRLIDFICGLGSNVLGYGNAEIANAVYQQAIKGPTLSLSSTLEIHLAEKIKEIIPWVQKMRFLKTGSDACSAAVRIARTKTGRKHVLSEGYHGWHDEFIGLTPPALGINPDCFMHKLDLDHWPNETIAAVILEPIMTDISQERVKWLRILREACTQNGTLLIFDEVVTGFRTPKFTMSNYFGIEPDILCIGKAMANGFPISAVCGRDEVMNCGEWFVSSTFAGETCSIAAALECIKQLQTTKYDIKDLWSAGEHFLSNFNALWPEKIKIQGYPSRGVFVGDPYIKALLWQEAYLADILFGSSFFLSFAHLPYLDRTLNCLKDIIVRIRSGSVELVGEPPRSPFSQQIREDKNDRSQEKTA